MDNYRATGLAEGMKTNRIEVQAIDNLRNLLQNHDFTYAYSDDHRVWLRGHVQLAKIKELREKVSSKDFNYLWNQYAPKTMQR